MLRVLQRWPCDTRHFYLVSNIWRPLSLAPLICLKHLTSIIWLFWYVWICWHAICNQIRTVANMCSVAIGQKKLVLIATHCMAAILWCIHQAANCQHYSVIVLPPNCTSFVRSCSIDISPFNRDSACTVLPRNKGAKSWPISQKNAAKHENRSSDSPARRKSVNIQNLGAA